MTRFHHKIHADKQGREMFVEAALEAAESVDNGFSFNDVDSLFLEPDSIVYIPSAPSDVIAGGSRRNYYIDYTIAEDADTGMVTLEARGYGYDGNSTEDTTYVVNDLDGATEAGTLTILRKVDLLVNAITSVRDTVSQGQSG